MLISKNDFSVCACVRVCVCACNRLASYSSNNPVQYGSTLERLVLSLFFFLFFYISFSLRLIHLNFGVKGLLHLPKI